MSDLTDALEWLEAWSHDAVSFRPIPIHRWPEIKELAAAARRVAQAPQWLQQLLENPPGELLWAAGGRDYNEADTIRRELVPFHSWTLITGGARGADLIAEELWRRMERPYVAIPARWGANGRAAGPIRNSVIVDTWRPSLLLAFPGGRGTEDAIRRARRAGIEVREIE